MKKLLSLVLCLALCLPVLALAEDTGMLDSLTQSAKTTHTVDFGTFTMELGENDLYEVADEMTSNAVYTIIYPDYDPNATTTDNINVVWSAASIDAELTTYGAETYAQMVLLAANEQFAALNITMSNAQVLAALYENGEYVSISYCELDYTGAGVELVTPQYQMQYYNTSEDGGTYIFTISTTSYERLEELSAYIDNVVFK